MFSNRKLYIKTKQRFLKFHRGRAAALDGCPQKKGICKRVYWDSPKKPNSAKRKIARLLLSTKKGVTAYIPGENHNLQNYSAVLIQGGRVKDMPGVNYQIIRGKYDCQCVLARRQGRSKYGTKLARNLITRGKLSK